MRHKERENMLYLLMLTLGWLVYSPVALTLLGIPVAAESLQTSQYRERPGVGYQPPYTHTPGAGYQPSHIYISGDPNQPPHTRSEATNNQATHTDEQALESSNPGNNLQLRSPQKSHTPTAYPQVQNQHTYPTASNSKNEKGLYLDSQQSENLGLHWITHMSPSKAIATEDLQGSSLRHIDARHNASEKESLVSTVPEGKNSVAISASETRLLTENPLEDEISSYGAHKMCDASSNTQEAKLNSSIEFGGGSSNDSNPFGRIRKLLGADVYGDTDPLSLWLTPHGMIKWFRAFFTSVEEAVLGFVYNTSLNATTEIPTRFDYIIVGAGVAGCPLAYTLASAGQKVLLLERGPERDAPVAKLTRDMSGAGLVIDDPVVSQRITTTQGVRTHIGSVMGGGSSINMAIYIEEEEEFFNYLKQEHGDLWDNQLINQAFAWVRDRVASPAVADKVSLLYASGLHSIGYAPNSQPSRSEESTASSAWGRAKQEPQLTHKISPGYVWRSYSLFDPARKFFRMAADVLLGRGGSNVVSMRPTTLTVQPEMTVERVEFEQLDTGITAKCVHYHETVLEDFAPIYSRRPDFLSLGYWTDLFYTFQHSIASKYAFMVNYFFQKRKGHYRACVREGGEIILSTGAIPTSLLLYKSGVGPLEEIREVGVPLIKEIPDLGRNFSDRVLIPIGAFFDQFNVLDYPQIPPIVAPYVGLRKAGPDCDNFSVGDRSFHCSLSAQEELHGSGVTEGVIYSTRFVFPPPWRDDPFIDFLFGLIRSCSSPENSLFGLKIRSICKHISMIGDCFRRAVSTFYFTSEPKSRGKISITADSKVYINANYLSEPQDLFDAIRGVSDMIRVINSDTFKGTIEPLKPSACPISILDGFLMAILDFEKNQPTSEIQNSSSLNEVREHLLDAWNVTVSDIKKCNPYATPKPISSLEFLEVLFPGNTSKFHHFLEYREGSGSSKETSGSDQASRAAGEEAHARASPEGDTHTQSHPEAQTQSHPEAYTQSHPEAHTHTSNREKNVLLKLQEGILPQEEATLHIPDPLQVAASPSTDAKAEKAFLLEGNSLNMNLTQNIKPPDECADSPNSQHSQKSSSFLWLNELVSPPSMSDYHRSPNSQDCESKTHTSQSMRSPSTSVITPIESQTQESSHILVNEVKISSNDGNHPESSDGSTYRPGAESNHENPSIRIRSSRAEASTEELDSREKLSSTDQSPSTTLTTPATHPPNTTRNPTSPPPKPDATHTHQNPIERCVLAQPTSLPSVEEDIKSLQQEFVREYNHWLHSQANGGSEGGENGSELHSTRETFKGFSSRVKDGKIIWVDGTNSTVAEGVMRFTPQERQKCLQWAATYPPVIPDPDDPIGVAQYALSYMTSIWHHAGTAGMGKVVDSNFNVEGINQLSIVDAGVLNQITRMNPTASIMMLGRYAGVKKLMNRGIAVVD